MLEIERKFRLPEGRPLQDLVPGLELGESHDFTLEAVYFDTPALTLARARTTLRRRQGGTDEGWHLKLPGTGDARQEVHAALDASPSPLQVPGELRDQVRDLIGWQPLVPVANLTTQRTETQLLDGGRVVAVVCQDQVTATRGEDRRTWAEAEVEVTTEEDAAAAQRQLDRIGEVLVQHGAEPLESPSKLVQALGDALAETLAHEPTAAEVLGDYIAAQVGMVQGREAGARVDAPESVHKMRVATRRLRSTLRTFRDLLDAPRTEPLRDEVRVLAEALGGPRDAEVLKARLVKAARQLPSAAVHGPVKQRIATELDARHEQALRDLVTYLDSERYRSLLDELVGLVVEPPFTAAADAPASEVLPDLLGRATGRVTKMWDKAEKASGERQLELAHEARKKAKAARYAWEAVGDRIGQGSGAAEAWTEVTESLGIAQDTVVARDCLRDLAEAAQANGEPTFTYGVLWQRELDHQDAAHAVAADAITRGREVSGSAR